MKVKRFVAPDMRQAIRWVREDQGSEAVILSTKRTDKGVEIVSAIDFDEAAVERLVDGARASTSRRAAPRPPVVKAARRSPLEPPATPAPQPAPVASAPADGARAAAAEARHHASPPDRAGASMPEASIAELRRELRSMRGLLQSELTALAGNDYARREPLRAQIVRRLKRIGLAGVSARMVADQIRDTRSIKRAWSETLRRLARRVPVSERDLLARGGRIALVGPTGVGKTATARKLAAAYAQRHGRQSVALIASDTDRLGAQRELLAVGQSLGVYTLVASGADELKDALDTVRDRRLVLIDTAGMGHRDPRLGEQSRLLAGLERVEPWLVLAANSQRAALEATIRKFSRLRPRGCVLTKVDECMALGEPVDALMRCGLPLTYLGTGQQVPGDLEPAVGRQVVARMVAIANRGTRPNQGGSRPGVRAHVAERTHA